MAIDKENLTNRLSRINLRKIVQLVSLLIIAVAAVQLYLFVHGIAQDGAASAFTYRPAVQEGFLPIGALMAAKYWLLTGIYDPVHPAGLTILLLALAVSLLFRRGFCSWFCPVGTVSEWLGILGERFLGKKDRRLPAALHYILMVLKYLLLILILYYFLLQSTEFISQFMNNSYYYVADIRIMEFWQDAGAGVFIFLAVMAVLSMIYKNFWCRYLCPYGTLLSLTGLLSPLGIVRNKESCINCSSCSRACPNKIDVAAKSRVNSVECTACLNCVRACPQAKTLTPKWFGIPMTPAGVAISLAAFYFGAVLLAKITGHWQTVITFNDYVQLLGSSKIGP